MVFPYSIASTPNAGDDPADDVTPMRTNFLNIGGFLTVDHVAPGTNDGGNKGAGFHKRITYYGNATPFTPQNTPVPLSSAYTVNGVADPTKVQNVWQNTAGVFPLSSIRAFGNFLTQAAVLPFPNVVNPTTPTSWYNVGSISHSATQTYIVNLTPGIFFFSVGASQPTVLITTSGVGGATNPVATAYTLAANTLTITVSSDTPNTKINFVILQF